MPATLLDGVRGRQDDQVTAPAEGALVRRLGALVESIHAVVYFAPEPQAAYAELGLKGYWRGYIASRSAPLGTAGPALVTALFGGFAPAMVARALPEVWAIASPLQSGPLDRQERRPPCAGSSPTTSWRRSPLLPR